VTPHQEEGVKNFLKGIALEWQQKKDLFDEIITIYIGGGTPSLLTPKQVEELLILFPKASKEITLEANPNDVTEEKMRVFKEAGINRVSIGVQSFDDETLQRIGRTHSAKKALDAIEMTYKAGIENISIDLMYDLPEQTLTSWQKSLEQVEKLPISHLSLYNLTFEEGSSYFKHQKKLLPLIPKEEDSLAMLEIAVERFEAFGFNRYEISAFARDGKVSNHNLGYWIGRPFLGLGPAAFSYTEGSRFQNVPHLARWFQKVSTGEDPTFFKETLTYPNNILELFAVRLRLMEGVDLLDFPTLPEETLKTVEELVDQELLTKKDSIIQLSKRGTLFYDSIASAII
jgi:oxygen-independent coproporphyrinogen-3 oxidase